jgi:hypothetical protein
MQLPPIRRLTVQDYVSQQGWIGPLLQNLNNFSDAVYNIFNKNIDLNNNSTGAISSVTITAVPTPNSPVNIAWAKTGTPSAVLIGNIQQRNLSKNNSLTQSGAVLSTAVSIEWQYVQGTVAHPGNKVSITNLVGVVPTGTLNIILTVVIF